MSEKEMRMQEEALFRKIESECGVVRNREEMSRLAAERANRKAATKHSMERTLIHCILLAAAFGITIVAGNVGLISKIASLCANVLIFGVICVRIGWGIRDVWGMSV